MEDQLIDTIDRALRKPECALGGGERNAEIKIAFLVLWALGWDPVMDVLLGFQIAKEKIGGKAKASNAADFVLRDAGKICVIGEAKEWFVSDKKWREGINQVSRYMRALPASRAFLTCGRRWRITDEEGNVCLDLIEETNAQKLIDGLRPFIGKGHVSGGLCPEKVWRQGLSRGGASIPA